MSYRAHGLNPQPVFQQSPHYDALDEGHPHDGESQRTGLAANGAAPLKIFLVEDSAMLRDRLSEVFENWGSVSMVGHAETEAVADVALRNCEWDVLILDLQLLQGTGLGVLRNLRGYRRPGTAVIVLTNYAIPSYRARSMELGADYFFDKTKDFAKIKDVFAELADKREHVAHPAESALRA
jgi:DNA-binding NarL/FixJ family response regulator